MTFVSVILAVLTFIWGLFKDWVFLFVSPIKKPEMLWIIIPIWMSWFFAEFFQEKKGTSFGNAVSNGVIPAFVSIDWLRYLTGLVLAHKIKLDYAVYIKYALCLLVMVYGLSIIIFGIKAKQFVHFYGRVREVTYVLLMFSPIIYNAVELRWEFLLSIFLFFPIYYYMIEFIDRLVPTPKIYQYDEGKTEPSGSEAEFKMPPGQGGDSSL